MGRPIVDQICRSSWDEKNLSARRFRLSAPTFIRWNLNMNVNLKTHIGLMLLVAPVACAAQSAANDYEPPCQGGVWWTESNATYADFDFWVGEWQVYERETGLLMGFDEITKVFGGCALSQHWRQMHDRYSLPGAPQRMEGGSHTALGADGRWHQTWLANTGSNITLSGQITDEGVMVLESDWIEYRTRRGQDVRVKHRWHWEPQDDGSIHNWGFTRRGDGEGSDWIKYYDIVYRRNAPGGVVFRRETEN